MIRADMIPDEVVEAAARAICAGNKWGEPCAEPCTDCAPEARASIAAGLNAWPGFEYKADAAFPAFEYGPAAIILPLPTEMSDE